MSAPLIEAADCTESGNNTATGSWAVARPAQADGDLLILILASDADVTHGTIPSGPNGETLTAIVNSYGGSAQRLSVWWWKANGSASSGSITVTPSASEQWTAIVVKVPAGEYDATTPIGASAPANDTGADANATSAAFTAGAADGGGRLCFAVAMDTVTLSTTAPTGWTHRITRDRGACGVALSTRDAETTNNESIGATDFALVSSETDSNVSFIVRGPAAPSSNPPPFLTRPFLTMQPQRPRGLASVPRRR
jgi:hypothetical protein